MQKSEPQVVPRVDLYDSREDQGNDPAAWDSSAFPSQRRTTQEIMEY